MRFEKISEGFVYRTDMEGTKQVASCSRSVLAADGTLLCSFFTQRSLGMNDYEMMISRSHDNGVTWTKPTVIWPRLHGIYSTCCSISRSDAGTLFLYGMRTPVGCPGESNWCEATQGMKQNELIYSLSDDNGYTWSDPSVIPMPISGSAEAPGPMRVLKNGRWIAPYSPYNTFDPDLIVQRNQVIAVFSDDNGANWKYSSMLRFDDVMSNGAEAWLAQLADGRLLGVSWHLNQRDGGDYPNAFALSYDGGSTWTKTASTGIMGQSTALTPLDSGEALFIYNQRKTGDIGVWLAIADPAEYDFGIRANEVIWKAQTRSDDKTNAAGHSDWVGFSFGEPSVTVLPDGTLFVALWCIHPEGSGIKYLKIKY
jgi:Neuraminidase (sialidase)